MAHGYRHRRRIFYFRRNSKDARETSAAEVVDGRSNTGRRFLVLDAIGACAEAKAYRLPFIRWLIHRHRTF
jgi:hypothetical protein